MYLTTLLFVKLALNELEWEKKITVVHPPVSHSFLKWCLMMSAAAL